MLYQMGLQHLIMPMSQAEKVALRYNYLMSVTGDVQGEFRKDIRNLGEPGSFTHSELPVTSRNRQLIAESFLLFKPQCSHVKAYASCEAFRNFMYVLMGKKLKGSQSGVSDIVSNLGGIETAGDNASSRA